MCENVIVFADTVFDGNWEGKVEEGKVKGRG